MSRADILEQAKASAGGRLPILRELYKLRRYGRGYILNAPALLSLTAASRLAEAVSVGLIVLMLQAVLGDSAGGEEVSGPIRIFADRVEAVTGGSLVALGGAIVGILFLRILADILLGIIDSRTYCAIADKVRRDLHAQYFGVAYAYIANHDQADLMNVIENEAENVPEAYQSVMEMFQEAVAFLIFGAMVVVVSWQIGLFAAVGGLILVLISHRMAQPILKLNEVAIGQHRQMIQRILVGLQGMRTIRAFAQEAAEGQRFARASRRLRNTHQRIDILQTYIDPVNELGYLVLLAGLVLVGVWTDPGLTGTVTALALLYRLQPHASGLQAAMLKLVTMTPHLSVVRSVLDSRGKDRMPEGDKAFARLEDAVVFKGVSMTYPGANKASLKNVSFRIPANRFTALLGPSGAGKTTVVNLLLRLYRADVGKVQVDGRDLLRIRRGDWLGRIALAGQDVDLVEGTVITNIRLSRPGASLEQVRRAADLAGILEDVEALSDGFTTWIGERGAMLSGGQRQRIGLARALLCEPDILILDEATSALDEPLERRIRDRILEAFRGRTVILITHRLHTVSDVDHAIWLEDGKVMEEGRPQGMKRLKSAVGV